MWRAVSRTGHRPAMPRSTGSLAAFVVAGQDYALPIAAVEEVLRLPGRHRAAAACRCGRGRVDRRARCLASLFSLRLLLALPATRSAGARIVVVKIGAQRWGWSWMRCARSCASTNGTSIRCRRCWRAGGRGADPGDLPARRRAAAGIGPRGRPSRPRGLDRTPDARSRGVDGGREGEPRRASNSFYSASARKSSGCRSAR
jgi:hypothetical protein